MKKRNPTIVNVSSRKVDSRESEARELVEWLKTIPSTQFVDPLVPIILLQRHDLDAVEKLVQISYYHLDHKIEGRFDFLRFFGERGTKCFGTVYMEYVPEDGVDHEHYNAYCTEEFHHVVDAVAAFKRRLLSSNPIHPSI